MIEMWYTASTHNCKMSLVGECLAHSGSVQVCHVFSYLVVWFIHSIDLDLAIAVAFMTSADHG